MGEYEAKVKKYDQGEQILKELYDQDNEVRFMDLAEELEIDTLQMGRILNEFDESHLTVRYRRDIGTTVDLGPRGEKYLEENDLIDERE